jgi:hypothetical protein
VAQWLPGEAAAIANARIISQLRPTSMSHVGRKLSRIKTSKEDSDFLTRNRNCRRLSSLQQG